jgi:hypothetical protein
MVADTVSRTKLACSHCAGEIFIFVRHVDGTKYLMAASTSGAFRDPKEEVQALNLRFDRDKGVWQRIEGAEIAGPWGINSYWIPEVHVERNPYFLFNLAVQRLSRLQGFAAGGSLGSVLRGESRVAFLKRDAKSLPIPDGSVNMTITDPPFGDEIQYFELSYLAASWLGVKMPFANEIVVNSKQGKPVSRYLADLSASFLELNRVLQKGGKAVFMLHDEEPEMLSQLRNTVVGAKFRVIKQDTAVMPQRRIGNRDERHGMELQILSCSK